MPMAANAHRCTAAMAALDTSVITQVGAPDPGLGCTSSVASARVFLTAVNADVAASVHVRALHEDLDRRSCTLWHEPPVKIYKAKEFLQLPLR